MSFESACMRYARIIISLLLLLPCFLCHAEDTVRRHVLETVVYYRSGSSELDRSFYGNGVRLDELLYSLDHIKYDKQFKILSIHIISGASPEGNSLTNAVLSNRRAERIYLLLSSRVQVNRNQMYSTSLGVDWEGLERLVSSSSMPYREEVLQILRNTPEWIRRDGVIVDGRKRQLGMLHDGKAWFYMEDYLFPELRYAKVRIVYESVNDEDKLEIADIKGPIYPLEGLSGINVRRVHTEVSLPATVKSSSIYAKIPFMSISTNLLYDVALVPNISMEFHLGGGWSLSGTYEHAWWDMDWKHIYWRLYGGELALRKYFGSMSKEHPLSGHHIGLYGMAGTYDFELGGRGYMSKLSYGGGIEYGYSLHVSDHFNVDFSLGLGYLGGEYMEYLPMDGHYVWQATRQRHWFGPTKAGISLVLIIDRYAKTGKGGAK